MSLEASVWRYPYFQEYFLKAIDGVSLDIGFLMTTKQDSTHIQNISISIAIN